LEFVKSLFLRALQFCEPINADVHLNAVNFYKPQQKLT